MVIIFPVRNWPNFWDNFQTPRWVLGLAQIQMNWTEETSLLGTFWSFDVRLPEGGVSLTRIIEGMFLFLWVLLHEMSWWLVWLPAWLRWVKDDFFACIIWTCWCALRSSRITLTGSLAPLSLFCLLQLDLKHVGSLAFGQGWFLCMYYLNMLMCNQKL